MPSHTSLLQKQFVLARPEPAAPEGWVRRAVGGWHLAHSPDLPVASTPFDEPGGLLLGWPIGNASDLGGRWVHIGPTKVRLDPLGSYSVVYHKEGVVASSTAVMPEELLEEDIALNRALGLPEHDHWYPFGLTPYRSVHRLLPDHVLHLPSFTLEREKLLNPSVSKDEEVADTVARNLASQLNALAQFAPLIMGLTAGNETRMLLSALRGQTDRVRLFTIGSAKSQDVETARELARRFDLNHEVWTPVRDLDEETAWFERIGRCVAGATMRNAALKKSIRGDTVFIKGIGGEIGRKRTAILAYYYRGESCADMRFDAERLIDRMRLPVVPALAEAAQAWLDGVPAGDACALLDRAYLENRVGCWAAPQLHGDTGPAANVWPLNQASTVSAMLSLSFEAKMSDRLCPMVVERLWPELLSVPINGLVGRKRFIAWLTSTSRRLAGFKKS